MDDRSACTERVGGGPGRGRDDEAVRDGFRKVLAVDKGVDGSEVGAVSAMESDFIHDLPAICCIGVSSRGGGGDG